LNIISYDIELTRKKKVTEEIQTLITSAISDNYSVDLGNRPLIESSWTELQYQELTSINSPAFLLFSFTIENVQIFLFKKTTPNVVSINELSITVVAISQKEINLILKSSYNKILNIFSNSLNVLVIEGTQVNLYPFDFEKNDVLSPSFYIKADYDNRVIKLDTKDWVKLFIFVIITCVFIVIYFTTPTEIIDPETKEKTANNLKEVYGSVMGLGLGFVIIELIANLLVPKLFKQKYPSVLIKNFSNIFENNGPTIVNEVPRPQDPIVV
jgi:hypothetical protein